MSFEAKIARKRFEHAPVGTWASYLGGGDDMLIGMSLTFRRDGTGTMEERGFDEQYDPAYVSEPTFRWRSIGCRCIEIAHRGKARAVTYDFQNTKNEYGLAELRMFESGRAPDEHGDIGFWISPFSLVYQEEMAGRPAIEKVREISERFWRRLKTRKERSGIEDKKEPNQSLEPTSGLRRAAAHL